MIENRLILFGHVMSRNGAEAMKVVVKMDIKEKRGRGITNKR